MKLHSVRSATLHTGVCNSSSETIQCKSVLSAHMQYLESLNTPETQVQAYTQYICGSKILCRLLHSLYISQLEMRMLTYGPSKQVGRKNTSTTTIS
jgi:hypothetical protein